ncbi:MAG: hypothetical protein WBU92_05000 [Candidatus Dormiibacterota bacterium]
MIELWLVLMLAVAVHETAHLVRMRAAHLSPVLTLGFLGVGWRFEPRLASARQLRSAWLIGPIAEALTWATAALLLRPEAAQLLLLMTVQLAANLMLPGSDGWRAAQTLLRPAPARQPAIRPAV